MSHPPVRIGFIGCGSVMQEAYLPLARDLQAQGLIQIIAACDTQAEREHLVTGAAGVPRFTTDYREIIAAPDIDLVLVLTPMQTHGPITRAALEAGKHVLVEKPIANTFEEAKAIVELAAHSKGILLPAPNVILSPTFQRLREHINRGDLGKILSARAFYGHSGPDWGPWYYKAGGGALFDLGVYNITSLTGLLGPVKRVTAFTGVAIPEREIEGKRITVEAEDNAHVLLDFGDAIFATVTTGFTIQNYRCPALELYGSKGTAQMLGDDWAPKGYEMFSNSTGTWETIAESAPDWPWTDGLRHLAECIQQGTRPSITPEHGLHVLEVMLKAKEAGRTGCAQTIETTFASA